MIVALLGASFQIGRSALAAYQAAIAVAGQNIANLGNPDYTRQTGRLSALIGGPVLGGVAPGGGVRLGELQRHVDEALENRLRLATGQRSASDTVARTLYQTETIYNELTEQDVSTQLGALFASFAQLQANPQDASTRNLVVASADDLVRSFSRQRAALLGQVRDLNQEAIDAVRRANGLISEIAALNERIVATESDGASVAGALRDRRDGLLRSLSELMDVQVRQQRSGSINLYVGSEPLVEFNRARGLVVETELADGLELSRIRFADDRGLVRPGGGRLGGVLAARDKHVVGQFERLDRLARGLIWEVNRIHSGGVGTVGYESVTSNYAVRDAGAALSAAEAGLAFPVVNGTFQVKVRDRDTGAIITRQIEVDLDGLGGDDTTLARLAGTLDGVPGLRAEVTGDRRLRVTADAGSEFWFNEDESGALAALGVAAFFSGTSAGDIEVDAQVRGDVRRIATSLAGGLNDGRIAGAIAGLAGSSAVSALLDFQSVSDFHAGSVGMLAVEGAAARTAAEASEAVYAALYAQREAISGVSLDEEAINLSRFERAFQGATRYIGVLDTLTSELLSIAR